MATFAQQRFSHAAYAVFRPQYPKHLYDKILSYHQGSRSLLLDLGCGHGVATRALASKFTKLTGVDPSLGMIQQAQGLSAGDQYRHVEYKQGTFESLPFASDDSVDLVTAAQSIHWADQPSMFRELKRVVRPGGSVGFWGYGHHAFVDYPDATRVLRIYNCDVDERYLGPYWTQPGSSIVQNNLREIHPPSDDWDCIERIEYVPGTRGVGSGKGKPLMSAKMSISQVMDYMRTWSAVHRWQESHPGNTSRKSGGTGDVIDIMVDEMIREETSWESVVELEKKMLHVEFGTGLILARKR